MNWDKYYLNICRSVAENSRCMSRKIGCILVRDKSILSTGYNGPPRGVEHCDTRHTHDKFLRTALEKNGVVTFYTLKYCPRQYLKYGSGEGLEYCIAAHAEVNTLINAARNGVKTDGCKLYMTCGIPCKNCLVAIINAGIEEIIVTDLEFYDEESKFLLETSGLRYRKFDIENI